MVGLYLESGQLPVRMPLYIGMVALARYLVLDMKEMDVWRMVGVSASVLVLALAVLVVRYGHVRFPYGRERKIDSRERSLIWKRKCSALSASMSDTPSNSGVSRVTATFAAIYCGWPPICSPYFIAPTRQNMPAASATAR